MVLLYIDTNIFMDAVRNRTNIFGKNIGDKASDMFLDSMNCKYFLAISTWTLFELGKQIEPEEIKMLFEMLKKKIRVIKHDDADVIKSKKMSNSHHQDALHIVLAEKCSADFIITRNIDDFAGIGTKIPLKKPEELG